MLPLKKTDTRGKVISMKLFLTLHATAELLTEQTAEECAETMKLALGTKFRGKEDAQGWELSHIDRNFFRPAVHLECVPDADGTILSVKFQPDRMLLIFMCIWTLIVIAVSAWKGWLTLIMLPVFWAVMIVGFSAGVQPVKDALMELFSANEVLD